SPGPIDGAIGKPSVVEARSISCLRADIDPSFRLGRAFGSLLALFEEERGDRRTPSCVGGRGDDRGEAQSKLPAPRRRKVLHRCDQPLLVRFGRPPEKGATLRARRKDALSRIARVTRAGDEPELDEL